MKRYFRILLIAAAVLSTGLLASSCGDSQKGKAPEKPEYYDTLKVLCEHTMKDMMQPAFNGFTNDYPAIILDIEYGTSLDCSKAILENKTNAVITSRDLTSDEQKLADSYKVKYAENPIAQDGFVFFTGKNFPFDSIHADQIKLWLTDKEYKLADLFPKMNFEPLLVTPKAESAIYYNLSLLCADGMEIKRPVRPLDDAEAIKQYVLENPNSIGVCYLSHLKDEEDLQAIRIGYHHKDGTREFPQIVHRSWIIQNRYPYEVRYDIVTRQGLSARNRTMKLLNYVYLDEDIQKGFFDAGMIPEHAKFELIKE